MTKKSRRLLFYASVLLFFIASYVAVLYAQGYKYSFEQSKFLKTGTISLKTNATAKVFLDDELVGSTSLLGNSSGINRLLPGQYRVRLERDDASSWKKTIPVQEGLVADFSRILLLPTNEEGVVKLTEEIQKILADPIIITAKLTSTKKSSESHDFFLQNGILYQIVDVKNKKIQDRVLGFSLSENDHKILWWTANELRVMWLDSTDYQPYHQASDQELISRLVAPIKKAGWFRGEDHVVVDSSGYKVIEIDTRGGVNIIKI